MERNKIVVDKEKAQSEIVSLYFKQNNDTRA